MVLVDLRQSKHTKRKMKSIRIPNFESSHFRIKTLFSHELMKKKEIGRVFTW